MFLDMDFTLNMEYDNDKDTGLVKQNFLTKKSNFFLTH